MDPLTTQFYDLIKKSKTRSPALDEMIGIMTILGTLPTIDQTMQYGNSLGEYDRAKNNISFHPAYGLNINTIPHEFSHALDNHLTGYLDSFKGTAPESVQKLRDARDKLNPNTSKLIPKTVTDNYRYSPGELRAHGVGNMEGPETLSDVFKISQARPHMDATMATEAAILRDLFRRALQTDGIKR